MKAIAAATNLAPEAVNDAIEALFLKLAKEASAGQESALRRLRLLQKAIVDREEQGESLSRLLPGGLAEKLQRDGRNIGETERLDVTVLMSDVRGYSAIAEHSDPTVLAGQLNEHRSAMNRAVLDNGGTVMQYVGDAVMAVFGAPFPQPDHADRALAAAIEMHVNQRRARTRQWLRRSLEPFGLGIGLSTGEVAAALLGSEERVEYTLVGDIVNLAQRLQDLARPAGTTVLSDATVAALRTPPRLEALEEQKVKGRETPVFAYRLSNQDAIAASRTEGERDHQRCRRIRLPGDGRPQDVRSRARAGAGRARCRSRHRAGRVRRDHGPVGLRQVDAAQSHRRPRCRRRRRDHDRGRGDHRAERRRPGAHAPASRRRRVPVLQPARGHERAGERRVAGGDRGRRSASRPRRGPRDLLDLLGLGDKAKDAPGLLSGGQRQRLAIARALANEPTLLLADEPTGALDTDGGQEVLELFKRLHSDGQTIIMVTHNEEVAAAADRIVRMRDGRIESTSPAHFDEPVAAAPAPD